MKTIIYKYVDFKGLKYVLNDETIKFTKPDDFNDPFEFHDKLVNHKVSLKHWKEIVRKREKNLTKERLNAHIQNFKINNSLQKFTEELFIERKNSTRISCFSETSENLLMWSHYADKHKGACIAFDTKMLNSTFTKDAQICKVKYFNKIRSENISTKREHAILHWITTKGRTWKYEKEIRIILGSNQAELQKFNIESIKEVIFGCKMLNEEKEQIEDIIYNQKNLEIIRTSEMNISKKKFRLEKNNRR